MSRCPACLEPFADNGFGGLAQHFVARAQASDADHVRWLNQNLSKRRLDPAEVDRRLAAQFDLSGRSLPEWVKARFIAKFFGANPHPFVSALQHPSAKVLLGYVLEHQHFLRQWVRSCAFIAARSDRDDVIRYEIDNMATEFGGFGPERPSHYELLLRMGESLGCSRERVLSTAALPVTRKSLDAWDRIATGTHWVEAMAAMHSLELIAHRDLLKEGATLHYFDPAILTGNDVTQETKAFLREGYAADVGHSDEALALVAKYARELGNTLDVQGTVLRSIDLFDDYLIARLERAEQLAGS
ncbi:MAG: iron-containing redox enzyme family protein [Thermoplasmata archaeon]|nr:iron-containing redox enzyme family protein [Thermoplasmata archaeon]